MLFRKKKKKKVFNKAISFPPAAREATTVSLPWAEHVSREDATPAGDSPLWNVVSPPCDGDAVFPRGAGVILERIDSIQKAFLFHQLLQTLCGKKAHHLSKAIPGSQQESKRQEQKGSNSHKPSATQGSQVGCLGK